MALSDEDVERVMTAVFAGRKIEAIRIYRSATKVGLKEAKDFIEALEARLRQELPEKFTAPIASGCARNAAMLVVLGVAIYSASRALWG